MPRSVFHRFRRGTASQWSAAAPVLAAGEPGYETDTANFKIGDGSSAWPVISPLASQAYADAKAPAGVVQMFAGAAAPAGFLLCDGGSYLRSDYPGLFNVIGSTYGSADGTHFNVPDLRGRTVFGHDTASFTPLGSTGGALSHSHLLSDLGQACLALVAATTSIVERRVSSSSWTSTHTINTTAAASVAVAETVGSALRGSTDTASTLPPYQVLNYLIKT